MTWFKRFSLRKRGSVFTNTPRRPGIVLGVGANELWRIRRDRIAAEHVATLDFVMQVDVSPAVDGLRRVASALSTLDLDHAAASVGGVTLAEFEANAKAFGEAVRRQSDDFARVMAMFSRKGGE